MEKGKILFVFGTRPEGIKLAPLINAYSKDKSFQVLTCNSGQHGAMLNQVVDFFLIPVDFELKVMTPNQNLTELTCSLLKAIGLVLEQVKPDLIVVQGDTTTSFCASLAAFYQRIPIAHIEAGLRTQNKWAPFPEEVNRIFNSVLSDLHFAPTETAANNLLSSGITKNVFVTGNTVIDALELAINKLHQNNYLPPWHDRLTGKKIILVTQHRRENFGAALKNILEALVQVALDNDDIQVVFPVHLNPNVKRQVEETIGENKDILLLDPLSYPEFIWIMDKCYFIMTDSGGVQEEAPTLHKPFIVTRETTERPEAIELGAGFIAGSKKNEILRLSSLLINNKEFYDRCMVKNPYGDGKASIRIKEHIDAYLFAK